MYTPNPSIKPTINPLQSIIITTKATTMGSKSSHLPILLVLFSLMASSAFSLRLLGDDLINPSFDPRRADLRRCQQRCEDSQQGFAQTRRCLQRCERRSSDTADDDVALFFENHHIHDQAEQQLERCQLQCETMQQGPRQIRACREMCDDQFRSQSRRGSHEGIRMYDEDMYSLRRDPQQKFRECRRRCERQEQGGRQQSQCEERCEKQFEREQRDDEVNTSGTEEEAERKYEQCQRKCRIDFPYRGTEVQAMLCRRRCREDYARQQRGEEVNPSGTEKEAERKCVRKCGRDFPSRGQEGEEFGCRIRCREEHARQQRDGEVNPSGTEKAAERKYKKCERKCQSDFPYRGQELQALRCRERCQEDYEREQGGGSGGGSQTKGMERLCRVVCQHRGEGSECESRCMRKAGGRDIEA